jgi:hypothetical protein
LRIWFSSSSKYSIASIKMNQVLTTILIVLLGAAVYMASIHGDVTKEDFWMIPSRQVKVEKMFKDPTTHDFFQVPNFQSILSPRFSNVNYGPALRTRFPNYNRMGVPQDPLQEDSNPPDPLNYAIDQGIPSQGFSEMTSNGPVSAYKAAFGDSNCTNNKRGPIERYQSNPQYGFQESKNLGNPKIPLDPHNPYSAAYANGNYNQVLNKVVGAGSVDGWPTDTVAELDQASFMTQDGEMKQPIVYDRYMYANRNSRLRGQGDPIRGDLPIVPISGNWFIPSAAAGNNINQVLQQGAMNVLGGVNNETNNALANLIYNSSGGADTTIGGVDMAKTNMSHQVYGAASAAMGDVQITSFP